uniref:DUF4685 domain-containing protein n=1 Tax=Suricata suricatta TaxID=37032 RepID=A0A673TN62_SURSU
MPRRHPNPWPQQVAPKGLPGDGARGRKDPLLPRLPPPQLRRLGAECVQALPPTSSAWQSKKSASKHCQHPPQCPHCSFPPDLRDQSLYFRNSLQKILPHQIPALGILRRDHSQSTTFKKAKHRPHRVQVPKLRAVLTHSSLGEGSGKRRRFCPFRVRFADETMWDTALRYWERSCTVRQARVTSGIDTRSITSEQVFRNVGRWPESWPKAPCRRATEEAVPSIWPSQEPRGHLSKDASPSSSLPLIPRTTTQRSQSGLKTFLAPHRSLEQVDRAPGSWSQKLESFLPAWCFTRP